MDLHDKLIALQRRNAGPVRRAERPSVTPSAPQATPQQPVASTSRPSNPQPAPHPPAPQSPPSRRQKPRDLNPADLVESFDRRKLSSSPGPSRPTPGRLYNPNFDPIPTQRTMQHRDVDGYSDASSNAPTPNHAHRRPPQPVQPSSNQRQLFDPRRDDPVRFSVLTRSTKPPPAPVGGYVSASSTSVSDVQSIGSNFTLTSGTTSSSASNPHSPASNQESGGAAVLQQFKKVYRQICELENQVRGEGPMGDVDMDGPVSSIHGSADKWTSRIQLHKSLAEADHRLLSLAMRPQVPTSLQSIPLKYNIPMRLWNNAFQHILQTLRIASATSPLAHEHLTSFIFYAYGFYTTLLEEENLATFRNSWIEALGDLARYQMAVASTSVTASNTAQPVNGVGRHLLIPEPSATPLNRSGGSPLPSVGAHAAAELDVDDERELWRKVARDWYTRGLKDTPGIGRLHHHLGLLCRDVEGEELQAGYHFVKGLLAAHPLDLARESILPLFSLAQQSARYQPSSSAPTIFLLMQGMLITRVQLDDFRPTLARFFERLRLEPESVTESEWIMMAVLNVGAVLDYGRPDGVIRKLGGLGSTGSVKSRSIDKIAERSSRNERSHRDDGMDGVVPTSIEPQNEELQDPEDERADMAAAMEALSTEATPPVDLSELPYTFQLALQLMFDTLSFTLRNPTIPSKSPFRPASLNPYITVVLTFLTTILRHEPTAAVFERSIPWAQLAHFLSQSYKFTQGSSDDPSKPVPRLISSSPLPEDWCLRGMEWVGRRVYERGFWRPSKSQSGIQGEMDVILPAPHPLDAADGIVEDGDGDGDSMTFDWNSKRWKRLRWCADSLVKCVRGLQLAGEGKSRTIGLGPLLQQKVELWRIERARDEEAEVRRRDRTRWKNLDDDMDVDEVLDDEEEDDDYEDDTPEVRALKARRRHLWNLQRSAMNQQPVQRVKRQRPGRPERPAIQAFPGYTILVCDTNVLLTSLSAVQGLIASQRWTVVLPLAVVTELDGLSQNTSELGHAARDAMAYLMTAVKTQSSSLKIQTSRGNYLSSLSVRSEEFSLRNSSFDQNMDDLILRTAIWQSDHFVDRSSLLKPSTRGGTRPDKASKVVLLSFDRNLRLKARARELDAADERDMAAILAAT